jgi:DNA-binding transcriptional regulator PaaX
VFRETTDIKAGFRMKALFATAVVAVLAFTSLAYAVETREEYKAQVEPICKVNSKANERILKPVRKLVKQNKLKQAAVRFNKASAALKKTWRQLKAVQPPVADEARIAKWLGLVKKEADLFAQAAKKLKAGKKGAAQKVVNKLTSTANQANATVLSFEFHFCRFEPSKFT